MIKASRFLLKADPSHQIYDAMSAKSPDGQRMNVCAMGLLAIVKGKLTQVKNLEMSSMELLEEEYQIPRGLKPLCPICDHDCEHVANAIVHLNDIHKQTFVQIGKFLERLGF